MQVIKLKIARSLLAAAILLLAGTATQAAVIDFDDNYLAPDSYYDPQAAVTWSSGGADFNHGWSTTYDCCWSGFTYSNKSDTTTAGYTNDRSAITGDGIGAGQDNYAVGYTGNGDAILSFGSAQTVLGGYFTNVTYTYLAMAYGDDGNDTPFVKGPFAEGDFLTLTITGLDSGGESLGSLDFRLADGANVLNTWAWFDTSGLGEVYGLDFALSSSDNGLYGMNTPAYFAVDSLSIVPLPAGVWLFISALGALGLRKRITG
ncbi:MAG: VPLPA-CTERM sorting domain-containing protein [Gammaproteobacteria bacterium]|nr:MAG: VPLPA-CTERM sorting domain-containing protein [Gammaproteobacteria bacterium]